MSVQAQDDLERVAADLDAAVAKITDLPAEAQAVVQDVIDALNRLHRDGLTTIVRRLRDDDRGRELLYELVDDPGVHMLLAMHSIIRPDPTTAARGALERISPALAEHGGAVELSHLDAGTAYVWLRGACNGCSMAAVTMRDSVEAALRAAVPGLRGVEVLPNEPSPTLIPLESLTVRRPDETEQLRAAGWCDVAGVAQASDGQVLPVTVQPDDGVPIDAVVVTAKGAHTAYLNACAHQGLRLDDALVDATEGTLTCPWHGLCYDVTEGECLTLPGARLQSLPLRVIGDRIWVRAKAD